MLDSPEFVAPSLTNDAMKEREESLAANSKPTLFKLRGQLLAQGRTDQVLAATEDLAIRLKIYASGGENELHAHPSEDHAFVVLQGSARFYGPENEQVELGKYEGIMLPKGNFYWFHATSAEPLVMIRVGSPNHKKQAKPTRINIKGQEMKGDSEENKKQPVIFKDEFFG